MFDKTTKRGSISGGGKEECWETHLSSWHLLAKERKKEGERRVGECCSFSHVCRLLHCSLILLTFLKHLSDLFVVFSLSLILLPVPYYFTKKETNITYKAFACLGFTRDHISSFSIRQIPLDTTYENNCTPSRCLESSSLPQTTTCEPTVSSPKFTQTRSIPLEMILGKVDDSPLFQTRFSSLGR